jgi:hypothetical protein
VSRPALSVAAIVAVSAVAIPSIAGGAPRAKVRMVTLSPLEIRGTHFHPRERVRVTATPGGRRRVRTAANGTFTASFGTVPVDRCNGARLTVVALGSRGDRAELALKLPQVACPPQN